MKRFDPPHLLRRLAAALIVLLLACLGTASPGAAQAASHPAGPAQTLPSSAVDTTYARQKPTIVFVHGAFADASGWDAEVKAFTKKGFTAYAPANPLRGLTSDADYIRSFLQTIKGPIVLVGHSYGGAVITNAASGVPNVKALVYISAFILADGESAAQASDGSKFPGGVLGPDTLTIRLVANPAAPGGQDQDLYISVDQYRAVFAGDRAAREAKVLGLTQRPLSAFAFNEPSGEPAWKTVPSWALVSLEDRAIPTSAEKFMARRAGARTTVVHSAHDSLISHPRLVEKIVLEAVRGTE